MTSRIALSGMMLMLVPSVAAQQMITVQVSDTTRNQVTSFEHSLRGAVNQAAGRFQNRVKEFVPDAKLAFQADTIVTSLMDPEQGAVFHVLIPGIAEVDRILIPLMMPRQPPPTQGARPVGATVVPDPAEPPRVLPDLDKEYGSQIRAALVDTILDNSLALRITETQSLTVYADELLADQADPFMQRARTLMLRIKGADLIALRENRIDREEAKSRILEYRY